MCSMSNVATWMLIGCAWRTLELSEEEAHWSCMGLQVAPR